MSRGRASVLSPSNQPLFEGQQVRNPTRVNKPEGGGDATEFPFEWSWPGLVNYTDPAPEIWTVNGANINYVFYSFVSNPTANITVEFRLNGAFFFSMTILAASPTGFQFIESGVVPALNRVDARVTNVGNGDGAGLWLGLTPYIPPA